LCKDGKFNKKNELLTEACNCFSELGHRWANHIFTNYTSLKSHRNYIFLKNIMQP